MKTTNSLFVHLLLIAKSSGKLYLEDSLEKHESTSSNTTLMKPDGCLLPSTNKSILIHELESIVAESAMSRIGEELTNQHNLTSIIIARYHGSLIGDGCLQKQNLKKFKDLVVCFV